VPAIRKVPPAVTKVITRAQSSTLWTSVPSLVKGLNFAGKGWENAQTFVIVPHAFPRVRPRRRARRSQ
jgi:hypothetical protein